jgi:HK97 family phage major capsid protein
MTVSILDGLREKRTALLGELEGLMSAEDFDPSDSSFTEARSRADALDSRIKAITEYDASRKAADSIDALSLRTSARETRSATSQSPGEVFVRSRAYSDYTWSGSSGRVEIEDFIQKRVALKTTDLGGVPDRFDVTDPHGYLPLSALVNQIQVSRNAIEYIKYTFTSAVAVVPEGGIKPESTLSREIVPKALENRASWVEATRALLEDETAIQSLIDDELRYAVSQSIEESIAAAITGATVPSVTGPDLLSAIRIGIGSIPDGYQANALLLHPSDLAQLDISVMVTAGIGPDSRAQFWGLVPVTSNLVTPGEVVLGDFKRGVSLWRKNGVQVFLTDSHSSNFIQNLIVILAEARSLADVVRPNALVKASVTPPLPLAAGTGRGGK